MQKDTTFWFYTWQDCDLVYASRLGEQAYCARDFHADCSTFSGDLQVLLCLCTH